MWFLIIGVIVLLIIIKFILSGTVKGFTKGIAKAQLRTFKALSKQYPKFEVKDLYIRMITNRRVTLTNKTYLVRVARAFRPCQMDRPIYFCAPNFEINLMSS